MARERMVTRTVEVNTYTVMVCNTKTAEVYNKEVKMGLIPVSIEPLKAIKQAHETAEEVIVTIISHTSEEILYGMSEQDFIAHAQILPPRKTTN